MNFLFENNKKDFFNLCAWTEIIQYIVRPKQLCDLLVTFLRYTPKYNLCQIILEQLSQTHSDLTIFKNLSHRPPDFSVSFNKLFESANELWRTGNLPPGKILPAA